ncbi:hypothetical protein A2U01_0088294, partial [Trifolium medium]|nr:hypothetical protein [Trifolium medium]
MKQGSSKAYAHAKKKKPEDKASTAKPSNAQRKLKYKQEE